MCESANRTVDDVMLCFPMTSCDRNLDGEVLFWGKNLPTVILVSLYTIVYYIFTITINDMLVSLWQRSGLVLCMCVKEIETKTIRKIVKISKPFRADPRS